MYAFLDELTVIRLQSLNRRHYESIIPSMLYNVTIFGTRLISWQFEQIVVYDIFMRRCYFFSHHLLEKRNPSFAVVKNLFVIVGGKGDDEEIP